LAFLKEAFMNTWAALLVLASGLAFTAIFAQLRHLAKRIEHLRYSVDSRIEHLSDFAQRLAEVEEELARQKVPTEKAIEALATLEAEMNDLRGHTERIGQALEETSVELAHLVAEIRGQQTKK